MPLNHKPASTAIYVEGGSANERADNLKASLKHAANRTGESWLKGTEVSDTLSTALNSMETSDPGNVTALQEQGMEEPLHQLRIYHDRAGTDAGLQSLLTETERDDHVVHVVTTNVDTLVDRESGVGRVEELVTSCGATVHFATHKIALMSGRPVEGARKRVVTTLADSLHPRSEGENTYQHTGGRPPLGFEAKDGRLVPADDYDRVCTILQQVRDSKTSKREAASMLGCVRATVLNALDRPSMYNLR